MTEDRIWGWWLIAAGIAALYWHPFDRIERAAGQGPELVLSIALLALAALSAWGAWRLERKGKARLLAWLVLP